jgi:4-amino-4-deoxy-L-arabinose transferase-like glycosyltransferase
MMFKLPRLSTGISLLLIFLLGLALRLVVWRWREFYPLGGDEQEYLGVALTMLRERRYEELLFMRPPLYPIFLAGAVYLFDSLVQNLRLVQALISAATIPFVYLLTQELSLQSSPAETHHPLPTTRAAGAAALLAALCYTLAANATELLSETLFLFGLTIVLWLLLRAGRLGRWQMAGLAGLALGALCLVRSVALPLLPLGALWLLLKVKGKRQKVNVALLPFLLFIFAFCLVVLPWTARNYATYGGLILIDTTGAENLWLDNDPAGREAVKAQLFALGDDRLARQQLAAAQGQAAILADPGRFLAKAQAELLKLFALEYSDDMLARPAIWLPPAEVWARLLLGDGLWLLILLAGGYGLGRVVADTLQVIATSLRERKHIDITKSRLRRLSAMLSPGLLLGPWALYIIVTAMIFHVELRYRLPLYPVLLPYAALVLAGEGRLPSTRRGYRQRIKSAWYRWRWFIAGLLPFTFYFLTLLHRPYPGIALQLGGKHLALAAAERSLAQGDAPGAETAAARALAADEGSALARVALARAALLRGDAPAAEAQLRAAIAAIPQHPHAHLLLGDLLRQRGDLDAAREELSFESGSLQDLQGWAWERFASPPPAALALGDGLDLGFLRGFHAVAEGEQGYRWTRGSAALRLSAPAGGGDLLLRLASGRPDGAATELQVLVNGQPLATLSVAAEWQEYRLPLPSGAAGALTIELRSATFAPRSFDRASPDGRQLGVMVGGAQVVAEGA